MDRGVRADALLDALSDSRRREVLVEIARGETTSALQLADRFEVTPQAVYRHLGILLGAGLVVRERRGRCFRYRVSASAVLTLIAWLSTTAREQG